MADPVGGGTEDGGRGRSRRRGGVSDAVPAGKVWRLIAVLLTLVTDANVANRRVHLTLDDGATVFFRRGSNATQAASLTQNYEFAARCAGSRGARPVRRRSASDDRSAAGARIKTVTVNKQAGDNYAAPSTTSKSSTRLARREEPYHERRGRHQEAEVVEGLATISRSTADLSARSCSARTMATSRTESVIEGGFIDVQTILASVGAPTGALQAEPAGDLQAAAAFNGAPWSTVGRKSIIPAFTGATTVKDNGGAQALRSRSRPRRSPAASSISSSSTGKSSMSPFEVEMLEASNRPPNGGHHV
jgi:hypothetical protein